MTGGDGALPHALGHLASEGDAAMGGTYPKTTLSNGLRIVTAAMPHTRSVTVSLNVGAGSRYEDESEAGVSHFLEHMCFKGTSVRPTPREVAEAIEGVGGFVNAATYRERTTFWCKVARPHFDVALDVLVDMLRHSSFEPSALERERGVILEELAMAEDSPDERVGQLIDALVWPDQALGRDVAGTRESVTALPRERIVGYLASQYLPNNVVVSVAGNVEHGQVVAAVARLLDDWSPAIPRAWHPARDGQTQPRLAVEHRATEQAHVCLALPGLSLRHADRYVLDLLNTVLGEGMSSRLFQEIREERGLSYDIHSFATNFLDTGSLSVYAGIEVERVTEAVEAVLEQLWRVSEDLSDQELAKAKELAKGHLLLAMEDSRSVAGWMGAQELLLKEIKSVDEVVDELQKVTSDEVRRVGRQLLRPELVNLAIVGPYRGQRRFQRVLGL